MPRRLAARDAAAAARRLAGLKNHEALATFTRPDRGAPTRRLRQHTAKSERARVAGHGQELRPVSIRRPRVPRFRARTSRRNLAFAGSQRQRREERRGRNCRGRGRRSSSRRTQRRGCRRRRRASHRLGGRGWRRGDFWIRSSKALRLRLRAVHVRERP
jgi:hypothetical protein